jgi:hypothetical protein
VTESQQPAAVCRRQQITGDVFELRRVGVEERDATARRTGELTRISPPSSITRAAIASASTCDPPLATGQPTA